MSTIQHPKSDQKIHLYSHSPHRDHQALEKNTLETSGEDAKLHWGRVEKMQNYARNERRRCKTTLETSEEDAKIHSKRVKKMQNYTRNEWRTRTFPRVSKSKICFFSRLISSFCRETSERCKSLSLRSSNSRDEMRS